MATCAGGRPCDEGNKLKDHWCVHDNGPPPPPSKHCGWRNERCCAHNVCKAERTECWEGTCMDCGKNGKPRCTKGKECDDGRVVNKVRGGIALFDIQKNSPEKGRIFPSKGATA